MTPVPMMHGRKVTWVHDRPLQGLKLKIQSIWTTLNPVPFKTRWKPAEAMSAQLQECWVFPETQFTGA